MKLMPFYSTKTIDQVAEASLSIAKLIREEAKLKKTERIDEYELYSGVLKMVKRDKDAVISKLKEAKTQEDLNEIKKESTAADIRDSHFTLGIIAAGLALAFASALLTPLGLGSVAASPAVGMAGIIIMVLGVVSFEFAEKERKRLVYRIRELEADAYYEHDVKSV